MLNAKKAYSDAADVRAGGLQREISWAQIESAIADSVCAGWLEAFIPLTMLPAKREVEFRSLLKSEGYTVRAVDGGFIVERGVPR